MPVEEMREWTRSRFSDCELNRHLGRVLSAPKLAFCILYHFCPKKRRCLRSSYLSLGRHAEDAQVCTSSVKAAGYIELHAAGGRQSNSDEPFTSSKAEIGRASCRERV